MIKARIIVIGAGISGATIARLYAESGYNVLIIEKRNHIAGNCYDFHNKDGILVSKYGAHLFHTNFEDVWAFVNRFSKWYFYEHRVKAWVDKMLVPVPVNITTVNMLLGTNIKSEAEMKRWLQENTVKFDNPKNGEEAALTLVGPQLYKKIFRNYTFKQWNKYPVELDASVLKRIPVRTNFDDRYFTDKYQYLPVGGYTRMFGKILRHPNIRIILNTDFFDIRDEIGDYEKIFYTGPIDQYFDFKFELERKLEYRSINFHWETHNREFYQSNSVINFPNDRKYTRIVEYKHFTGQKHPKTTISKETTTDIGEPYYPVPNPQNREVYEMYRKLADETKNVYFVGRLASYKYFNMDQAFKNAIDTFRQVHKKSRVVGKYFIPIPVKPLAAQYISADSES